MPDAVVVAAGRSPIGRAAKGTLVDVRPDDLGAHIVSRVLEQVPELETTASTTSSAGAAVPAASRASTSAGW